MARRRAGADVGGVAARRFTMFLRMALSALTVLVLSAGCAAPGGVFVTPAPGTPTAMVQPAEAQPATTDAVRVTVATAPAAPAPAAPAAAPALPTAGPAAPAAAAAQGPAPTPQAPLDPERPKAQWTIKEERTVGPYTVRQWHDQASDMPWGDIATISAPGRPQIQMTMMSAIGDTTGKDLTGDGVPDIEIQTYSGGAHCCFGTVLYQAGSTLTKLLDYQGNNCAGNFQDLNGDGKYEFVTCDDLFAYTYCPFAGSPMVRVIYQYKPGAGYRPASPKFASAYQQDIADHTTLAQTGKPDDAGEWDHTNKCSVLPLVLDYLYSGQSTQAWQALDQYYRGPDAQQFRSDIQSQVSQSPRFVTP
jgi:hypothetical protein